MDPTTTLAHNPPGSHTPSMLLPSHVDGIVDLKTLGDIHRYLSESENGEDLTLASWVKSHYLYEPIDAEGREIRTTEGFSKLDRAYRRVRSLTNKAQDKWPFFDRAWKKMSANTVRKNGRGEVAPGVSLPGMTNAARDSMVSSDTDAHNGDTFPEASAFVPFVPFETNRPIQQDSSLHSTPNTPVTSLSSKQALQNGHYDSENFSDAQTQPEFAAQSQAESTSIEFLQKSTGLSSHADAQSCALSESTEGVENEGMQVLFEESTDRSTSATTMSDRSQGSESSQPITDDTAQDAGAGKVRGSNGRFMPKDDFAQTPGRPKTKTAKKVTTLEKDTTEFKVAESAPHFPAGHEDETMVDVVSTSVPEVNEESDKVAGLQHRSESATEAQSYTDETPDSVYNSSSRSVSEPTRTFTLAAEAPSVPSNLDRFPPGCWQAKKRKRESLAKEAPSRKRKLQTETAEKDGAKKQSKSPRANTKVPETPFQMTTRRATRQSAAAKLNETTPAKPASPQPGSKKHRDHNPNGPEDKAMLDVDNGTDNAGQKTSAPAPVVSKVPAPRLSRTKTSVIPETPEQSALSALPKVPSGSKDFDIFTLGRINTSSMHEQSKKKRSAVTSRPSGLAQEDDAVSNGTHKAGSKIVAEFTANAASKSTPAPKVQAVNGTAHDLSVGDATAGPGQTKVNYFARIHTTMGVMEVPVTTEDLTENTEVIQKYADWMEKEGVQIPYHSFKSIFGFAKKG